MKKLLLFILVLCTGSYASAQTTISGVVSSGADGLTMPGVSVTVKGTASGTATDMDGNFTVTIPSDRAVLVFTYIGYKAKEVSVTGSSKNLQVVMDEDNQLLDELVVVGYGTMKKSDLTGSVGQLSSSRLSESVITNLDQALQGRVAGVQMSANSGAPGSANTIRIRGASSLSSTNEPLYVIDGIPMSGTGTGTLSSEAITGSGGQNMVNPLAAINPNDIVSIDVLKDASATAIYGSAGANGVIMVTTRRGQAGTATITYDGYAALQMRAGKYDMMNLREFGTYQNQLYQEGFYQKTSIDQAYLDPSLLGRGTDWQDAVSRDAFMTGHNLSMTGGSDKTQYAISLGYNGQDGVLINSDFRRYTGRINLDHQFSKFFKMGGSLNYANTVENLVNNDGINGLVMNASLMSPAVPVYDFDGNYAGPETTNGTSMYNPLAFYKDQTNRMQRDRIMGNVYTQINFLPSLNLRTELGIDNENSKNLLFKPSYEYGLLVNKNAAILQQDNRNFFWNIKNYLTWTQTIAEVHNLNVMVGQEAQESGWEYLQLYKDNLTSNDIRVVGKDGTLKSNNGAKEHTTKASFFGRLNYNFADRYLLTTTLRADGSSVFGANNKWGYFPSVALAWRLSNEAFMQNTQDYLSNLKIRVGYGQSGNDNIPAYQYGSTMRPLPSTWGTLYRMSNNANPNLKWEASEQFNGGIDLGLWNGRIDLSIDAYYKTSRDLLMQPSVSPVLGGSSEEDDITTAWMNVGRIENKGIEIALNTHNIKSGDFNWHSNIAFSLNRNKVLELDYLETPFTRSLYQMIFSNDFNTVSKTMVGHPIGVFWGYQADGLIQNADEARDWAAATGKDVHRTSGVWVGDMKFKDINGKDANGNLTGQPDGKVDENDQTVIGDPNPDFTFGFTNTFTYKGFELLVGLNASIGGDILNVVRWKTEALGSQWDNQSRTVLDRARLGYYDDDPWSKTAPSDIDNAYLLNPDATMPRFSNVDINANKRMSDRWIEDGSYLRIQNIRLGYNIPKSAIETLGVKACKLYVNMQNVYTFTKYSGLDAEIGAYKQDALLQNIDLGRYPAPRIFTLGVTVSF
jgi:TonB-linked SusC/RagA family outer membrane protein